MEVEAIVEDSLIKNLNKKHENKNISDQRNRDFDRNGWSRDEGKLILLEIQLFG